MARNGGGGKRSGHKGGHRHPTTVKDLLERCVAAGLLVEELDSKGGHYKITRPPEWPAPPKMTSGIVFVSSTTEFRAIAKNTGTIFRETGVDVREIDPAEARRQARRNEAAAMSETSEVPEAPVDEVPEASAEADPAEPIEPKVVEAIPRATERSGPAIAAEVADRLRFVAEMRADGHTDTEIATAMGKSPNWLAAFLTNTRKRGHPLAVPPRKRYTDPQTGAVTRPGVMPRRTTKALPAPTTTAPVKPKPIRRAGTTRPDQAAAVEAWLAVHGESVDEQAASVARQGAVDPIKATRRTAQRAGEQLLASLTASATAAPEGEPVEPEQQPETDQVEPEVDQDRNEVTPRAGALVIEEELLPLVERQPRLVGREAGEAAVRRFLVLQEALATVIRDRDEVIADGTAAIETMTVPLVGPPAEPGSAGQDGLGAPSAAEPVSVAPADDTEPLSADSAAPEPEPESHPAHHQVARYATVCAVCEREIRPGARILPVRHRWVHAEHGEAVSAVSTAATHSARLTAVTVLEAALRQVGVADPELVARNLRIELADTGWRLRVEASL